MTKRKLAAVMFTDIAGYSAMMHRDEAHAVGVQSRFKELVEKFVTQHSGDIIQFYGDGCLVLFESATQAVACAKELQLAFIDESDIPVRIGIHSGDVLIKEGNAYGNSVNIASRIESMGVPGCVLFSKTIFEQIRNKQNFEVKSLGTHHFKNVDEPIEVFVLVHQNLTQPDLKNLDGKFAKRPSVEKKKLDRKWIGLISLVATMIAFVFFWPKKTNSSQPSSSNYDVAILPFQVNGPDELNYLGQGIPDILSIKLEGAGGIRVMDRNTLAGFDIQNQTTQELINTALTKNPNLDQYVTGSINALGDQLDLSAVLYDRNGKKLITATERGESKEQLHRLVDGLARKLIAKKFDLDGDDILKTAALSSDLNAMKYFLNGEQKMRGLQRRQAIEDYKNAYEIDTTFALALYRLVYLENVLFRSKGDFRRIQKLQKLKEQLPIKNKLLAEALLLYLGRNANGAINAYAEIVSTYPDDIEANLMMAKALFNYNRLIGRPISQAKPFFEKVLQLDDSFTSAKSGLWMLEFIDGNCAPPQHHKSDEFGIFNITAWASICKDSTTQDSFAEIAIHDPTFVPSGFLANFIHGDKIINAFEFLDHVTKKGVANPDPIFENMTRGQDQSAFRIQNPTFNLIRSIVVMRIAGHPEVPIAQEFYPTIDRHLVQSERTLEALPFASKWNFHESKCMISLLMNQQDTFDLYLNLIKAQANANPDYQEYARLCEAYFSGIRSFRQADYETAEMHFSKMDDLSMPLSDLQNQFYERPLARLMRGDICMKDGRYEEALGWYENFMMQPSTVPLLPWTFLRRAQIYETLDRTSEALQFYNLFLELLKNADAQYEPYVTKAKQQRDALVQKIG